MNSAKVVLLGLSLGVCAAQSACASARTRIAHAAAPALEPARDHDAASRLGPPSPRGMSFRRVDRPANAEPPIALY